MRVITLLSVLLISPAFGQEELRMSIYFDGGSYEVGDDQDKKLSDWLDSIPNLLEKYEIELISHTDPVGGRKFNQWLSRMRSSEVRDILIRRFIPQELIHIRDWGYERPVYDNNTFGGRIMNRRVDVVVRPVAF
jgi:outer membrane protein OmpA-like peptidoglycan-associated protein